MRHDVGVRRRASLILVLLVVAVAACGGDDTPDTSDTSAVETAEAPSSTLLVTTTTSAPSGEEACPAATGDLARFGSTSITVIAPEGDAVARCVLVADTADLRNRGLMGVTDLQGFDAMVFAYADTSWGGYWMKDTPMPLTIAWIGVDGEVVGTADMAPCLDRGSDCPSYDPGAEYRWAVEVPQGGLDELGLVDGAVLDVETLPVGRD